jgi:hypothetical protein
VDYQYAQEGASTLSVSRSDLSSVSLEELLSGFPYQNQTNLARQRELNNDQRIPAQWQWRQSTSRGLIVQRAHF